MKKHYCPNCDKEDNVERTIREFNGFLHCLHDKSYAFGVLIWIKYFLSNEEFETLRDNVLKRTEE